MAVDNFASFANLTNPPTRSVPVVPGEQEIEVTRALFVGKGGSLVIRLRDDSADWVISAVPDNSQLDYLVKLVRAAGTTATEIRALY